MKTFHKSKIETKIKIEDLETTEFQDLIQDLNDEEIGKIVGGDKPGPCPCGCRGDSADKRCMRNFKPWLTQ
ncbi:MAG: hypothetical protein ACRC80_35565 [Waterburya sp.]